MDWIIDDLPFGLLNALSVVFSLNLAYQIVVDVNFFFAHGIDHKQ